MAAPHELAIIGVNRFAVSESRRLSAAKTEAEMRLRVNFFAFRQIPRPDHYQQMPTARRFIGMHQR